MCSRAAGVVARPIWALTVDEGVADFGDRPVATEAVSSCWMRVARST